MNFNQNHNKNSENKFVSVIIAAYNVEDFIESAIESVLNQTCSNYEIIVIDDGSTDMTFGILSEYSDNNTIKLYHKPHSGNIGKLRNIAVNYSSGKYLSFLDGDDIWMADKLNKQLSFTDKFTMVCSNASTVNDRNTIISNSYFEDMLEDSTLTLENILINNYVLTSSVLIARDIFLKFGGFEEIFGYRGEDYLLWLKIAEKYPIKFINEKLINYRRHENNLSYLNINERIELLYKTAEIREKYLNHNESAIRVSAVRGLIPVYYELLRKCFKERRYIETRAVLKKRMEICPKKLSVKYIKFLLVYYLLLIFGFFSKR